MRVPIRNAGWAIALVAITLSGCTAQYRNHGYVPSQEILDSIVVGVDTRDTVLETAGSPSSLGMLETGGAYYVRSRMRNFAIRAPEEVERDIVAISFDANGVVSNIERFGLEDGRMVTLERRITDNATTRPKFLSQLLRNLGRFAPPAPAI